MALFSSDCKLNLSLRLMRVYTRMQENRQSTPFTNSLEERKYKLRYMQYCRAMIGHFRD